MTLGGGMSKGLILIGLLLVIWSGYVSLWRDGCGGIGYLLGLGIIVLGVALHEEES